MSVADKLVAADNDEFLGAADQIVAVIEEAEALVSDCGPCNGGVTDDDCFLCGHLRRALAALESRLS